MLDGFLELPQSPDIPAQGADLIGQGLVFFLEARALLLDEAYKLRISR